MVTTEALGKLAHGVAWLIYGVSALVLMAYLQAEGTDRLLFVLCGVAGLCMFVVRVFDAIRAETLANLKLQREERAFVYYSGAPKRVSRNLDAELVLLDVQRVLLDIEEAEGA